ncbi:MAG: AAA family ATPase [Lachnospiraceae bacterium]|nr:AAA family ATPase [Lachnospiraceae bacterium]
MTEVNKDFKLAPIASNTISLQAGFEEDNTIEELLQEMGTDSGSKTLFRDDVIREICSIIISDKKPNAMLIGPAGSGKTEIAEELARRMKRKDKSVPKKLYDYEVYSLNLSDLVLDCSLRGELERRVKDLVTYLESDDNKVILFLDEVHILFENESYKNVAQMLKPALGRGEFKVIAATTTQEVKRVEEDPAFNRRFTRVLVNELTKEQTEQILKSAVKRLEAHYDVKISFGRSVAKMIVAVADEFCSVGSHRPDNALTLMDRAVAAKVIELQENASEPENTVILDEKLVEDTAFRLISGSSVKKEFDERSFRKALSRIRGQQDILDDIVKVIKLYDLHLRPHNKPLTFMFAGPSGVGKSEVAKIIAGEYIGEKPIILNMAEYNSSASINRIIGAPAGYTGSESNRELPFDALDTNPYQVILLDEFEKCDRSVQRLFMSAFDEGVMVTNSGKEIDFSKTVIIATTNAGCTDKTGNLGFAMEDKDDALSVADLSGSFDTELINRFSHKYTFHGISRSVYEQVIKDCLEEEISEIKAERAGNKILKKLKSVITDETVERLCDRSYNAKLGARPAKTAVQEFIDEMVLSCMDGEKS